MALSLLIALFTNSKAPRGTLVLLIALFVGVLLPLAFLVDGEKSESALCRLQGGKETVFCRLFIEDYRCLHLKEQPLLSVPPKAETLALIRTNQLDDAKRQIEPINLSGRSLRKAHLESSILVAADLREAHLEGAILEGAHLEGAYLEKAHLESTNLKFAHLKGTNLRWAKLEHAILVEAYLDGADLTWADLEGAVLANAHLEGASFWQADLEGVYLDNAHLGGAILAGAHLEGAMSEGVHLEGANLQKAEFDGADLQNAKFDGADLRGANIYGTNFLEGRLIDVRGIGFKQLSKEDLERLTGMLRSIAARPAVARYWKDSIERSVKRLESATEDQTTTQSLQSCLAEAENPLSSRCAKRFDPATSDMNEFTKQLHSELTRLACRSRGIAIGIVRQVPALTMHILPPPPTRIGLEKSLAKELRSNESCSGLQELPNGLKKAILQIPESELKQTSSGSSGK